MFESIMTWKCLRQKTLVGDIPLHVFVKLLKIKKIDEENDLFVNCLFSKVRKNSNNSDGCKLSIISMDEYNVSSMH